MISGLKREDRIICWLILSIFLCLSTNILGQPQFTDVTEQAGIDHIFHVFEGTFGGGAAVIDIDQDGWEDVFLAGGAEGNQLLKNQGDGTFKDISEEAGLNSLDGLVTQGAASADVNRDGWPDLFVTTIAVVAGTTFTEAPNVLLINNQDGSFSDQSVAYGIVEPTFSSSASFGDVNQDGYPDLYVSNYFDNFEGRLDDFSGPISGGSTQPGKDLFYLNDQGRRFIESSQAYGIDHIGLGFQGLWTDFDNDRDLDLLIANDFGNRTTPNLLYRNDYPASSFTEIGEEMNFDFGINGMGIGACDINMDGMLDYFVTNIQASPLFINHGAEAPFTEESIPRGSGFFTVITDNGNGITPISWGVNFFDMDHDMDQDLFISNGCLNPMLAPNPNLMLENTNGRFQDKAKLSLTNDHSIGRGSVVFDYDQDGDMDLLVVNQGPHEEEDIGIDFLGTRLYRNDHNNQQGWLKVKLKGDRSDLQGIGSRVEARMGDKLLVREVYAGASHESQNSTIVHFGLGTNSTVDSLTVKWTSGITQVIPNVSANQTIEVVEKGRVDTGEKGEMTAFPTYFDETITLKYSFPESANFHLSVLDAQGRRIAQLIKKGQGFGGSYLWQVPNDLGAGLYMFLLQTDTENYVSKAIKY